MKPTVFIATPISGFEDENEYGIFRRNIKTSIRRLSKKMIIISELINISDATAYESPAMSVEIDLKNIENSSYFVLIYPRKTPTSALIELGYALAKKKKILILTKNQETLPYMLKKIDNVYSNIKISYYSDDCNIENNISNFVSKV